MRNVLIKYFDSTDAVGITYPSRILGYMATSHDSITAEAMQEGMALRDRFSDRQAIVQTVRVLGAAMITILLIAVVLNEVFGAVDVGSGPFSGIASDLTTTGVAAMSLLVVGLLIVAANRLMGIFGGGGGM